MLHELLLALSGHPGSIFVKNENDEIKPVAELPFIHPAEETLLSRICRLATCYYKFVSFTKKYGHAPFGGNKVGLHGLYVRAFCQGLDCILNPYRQALLDLEKNLLADPHLTAAHVQHYLEEYQLLFPALISVLDQIESQKAHGCHILEILHRSSVCGTPIVKNALIKILHVCNGVFYKQLGAWMLHGMLLDSYGEFFVHKSDTENSKTWSHMENEDQSLGGVTVKEIHKVIQLSEGHEKNEQYGVRAEMLPSYIPSRIAEKILFVGESVKMFEKEKEFSKHRNKGSILCEKEDEFAKELHALSKQPDFDIMTFESVIDTIRTYAAEQLWKLVVEDSDLVGNLKIMKDFFLLGRGELFLCFIDQAQNLLRVPPTGSTQHDVNMAFQQAARNVLFEDDVLMQKFQLNVEVKEKTQQKEGTKKSDQTSTDTGWNALNLTYIVDWPLHILFTKGVIQRYNTLFKFLLFVKRIQLELQHCWAQQMNRKHLKKSDDVGASKWWLRNHMAFLIDNLQYYLQVDVIESQFSILQDRIQSTRDFEAIQRAHEQFLSSLLAQSFLLMKPVAHCLNEILELCHSFCIVYMQSDENLTPRQTGYLDNITKNFQRQSNLLFKNLSSVRSHQTSPHLAQLLLRIDFNKYFTLAGGQLGNQQIDPEDIVASAQN